MHSRKIVHAVLHDVYISGDFGICTLSIPGLTTLFDIQGAQLMKKLFSKTLQAGSLMMCLSLLSSVSAAQAHKAISLAGPESKLPFSDGIVAGNTLYVAGQEGRTADGKLAEGGTAGETRAALEAVQKVVKAAGFEMQDIVSVNVFLADIKDFDEMNKVYKTIMPDPKPARATVAVSGLVGAAHIEISAIAVKR
jgi:2-iminobutanoate/2-iminopropanoate deaminase